MDYTCYYFHDKFSSFFGVFNVTAMASNRVTDSSISDEFSAIVTGKPCAPPEAIIPINSTDNRAPKQYKRTDTVQIASLAALNCSDVLNTR